MNTPKDMLDHIREEEKILGISLAQSRLNKKERTERQPMQQQRSLTPAQHKEWIRQQKLSCHNQD
jgi:hypothetical protein|tara:strand:- start:213 stop:407 length:195 start_codon:yes stop_codon:yes gene_type:complete